jgi:hypothetical protein
MRKAIATYSSGKIFDLKSCRRVGGREVVLRKNFFREKNFEQGPLEKNLPQAPANLSAALVKTENETQACI